VVRVKACFASAHAAHLTGSFFALVAKFPPCAGIQPCFVILKSHNEKPVIAATMTGFRVTSEPTLKNDDVNRCSDRTKQN